MLQLTFICEDHRKVKAVRAVPNGAPAKVEVCNATLNIDEADPGNIKLFPEGGKPQGQLTLNMLSAEAGAKLEYGKAYRVTIEAA